MQYFLLRRFSKGVRSPRGITQINQCIVGLNLLSPNVEDYIRVRTPHRTFGTVNHSVIDFAAPPYPKVPGNTQRT